MRKKDYKSSFLDQLLSDYLSREIQILDMGSGTSANFLHILSNQNIKYTGIEFNKKSFEKAKFNLKNYSNVTLLNGYGEDLKLKSNTFDIVISLSVLEHVKELEDFLLKSIELCKPGGMVVHRYDLGHSLYPASFGEQLNVAFCKYFPFFVPKRKIFTTHPSKDIIVKVLNDNGLKNIDVDYSQLFAQKKLINKLKADRLGDNSMADKMLAFEKELKDYFFEMLTDQEKELIFPSVTIKGIKS
jgi:ubiquinone/menaquinone biosynthesis C-methylase UbiE